MILILNGNEEETLIGDDEEKETDSVKEELLAISSNGVHQLSDNHCPFDYSLVGEAAGEAFHSGRSFSIFVPGSILHF